MKDEELIQELIDTLKSVRQTNERIIDLFESRNEIFERYPN